MKNGFVTEVLDAEQLLTRRGRWQGQWPKSLRAHSLPPHPPPIRRRNQGKKKNKTNYGTETTRQSSDCIFQPPTARRGRDSDIPTHGTVCPPEPAKRAAASLGRRCGGRGGSRHRRAEVSQLVPSCGRGPRLTPARPPLEARR